MESPAERRVLRAATLGEEADLTELSDEASDLSAEFVRGLCVGPDAAKIDSRGVWIRGGRIRGELNLGFAQIPHPLVFSGIHFEKPPIFEQCRLPALYFEDCSLSSCGSVVASRTRTYCDACLAGAASGDTRLKRAAASSRQQEALAEWRLAGFERQEPEIFRKEILPLLKRMPIRKMMTATGLSEPYCHRIRRGEAVPHRRHWQALRELAEELAKGTLA